MSRSLLLLLSVLFFKTAQTHAQPDYSNCIQVVASTGKSAELNGRKWSYTVGEAFITTLTGSNSVVFTQGFHQPELCGIVATHDLDIELWELMVFPNPTADYVTVRYSDRQNARLEASVFDLMGRPILTSFLLADPSGTSLDCSDWQAGVYLLQLRDPSTGAGAVVRFVRL